MTYGRNDMGCFREICHHTHRDANTSECIRHSVTCDSVRFHYVHQAVDRALHRTTRFSGLPVRTTPLKCRWALEKTPFPPMRICSLVTPAAVTYLTLPPGCPGVSHVKLHHQFRTGCRQMNLRSGYRKLGTSSLNFRALPLNTKGKFGNSSNYLKRHCDIEP